MQINEGRIGEIIIKFGAKAQSTVLARLVSGWIIEKSTPEPAVEVCGFCWIGEALVGCEQ